MIVCRAGKAKRAHTPYLPPLAGEDREVARHGAQERAFAHSTPLRGFQSGQPPYLTSGRIGGWKARPESHGKTIQVSWDTSVMKVSTKGRPMGLA